MEAVDALREETQRIPTKLVEVMREERGAIGIPTGFDIESGYQLHGNVIRAGRSVDEQMDLLHVLTLAVAGDKLYKFMKERHGGGDLPVGLQFANWCKTSGVSWQSALGEATPFTSNYKPLSMSGYKWERMQPGAANILVESLECEKSRACLRKAILSPRMSEANRFQTLLSGEIHGIAPKSFVKAKRCLIMAMLGGLVELDVSEIPMKIQPNKGSHSALVKLCGRDMEVKEADGILCNVVEKSGLSCSVVENALCEWWRRYNKSSKIPMDTFVPGMKFSHVLFCNERGITCSRQLAAFTRKVKSSGADICDDTVKGAITDVDMCVLPTPLA